MIHLWLATYVRVGLILAAAFVLGFPLVAPVVRGACRWPLSVIAGAGLLSLVVCSLSWVHAFTPATLPAAGAAGAAVTLFVARRCMIFQGLDCAGAWWRNLVRWSPYAAVLGLFFAYASRLPLYPATGFDTTLYHLPLANDLVVHSGFVDDAAVRHTFFPQANEAIFAVALQVTPNPVVAQGFEFALLAVSVWMVMAFIHDMGGRPAAAFVAGLTMLASPLVLDLSVAAWIDLWPMAFLLAGFAVLALHAEARTRGSLGPWLLAGFLMGQAAASKYTAVALVAVVVMAYVATHFDRHSWRSGLLALGVGGLGFVVVAAPWYARPWLLTGDPFYPVLTSVFGATSGPYSPVEIAYWSDAVRESTSDVTSVLARDLDHLRATVPSEMPPGVPELNLLCAAGMVGTFLRGAWQRRAYRAAVLSLVVMCGLWVAQTPVQRYMVPTAGLFGVAAGLTAEHALAALGDGLRRRMRLAGIALAAAVALAPPVYLTHEFVRGNGPVPITAEARADFLNVRMPCITGLNYLNGRYGTHYTAYGIGCERSHYYAAGTLFGDWFGPASYFRVLGPKVHMPAPDVLAGNLRGVGATFLVLTTTTSAPSDVAALRRSPRFVVAFEDASAIVLAMT